MHTPWAGNHQRLDSGSHPPSHCGRFRGRPTGTMISELNTIQGSTASRCLSSSRSFLCTLQRGTSETSPGLRLHAPYRHAATLDTEPLAKSYSGGCPTRLSSKHFQSARAWICQNGKAWCILDDGAATGVFEQVDATAGGDWRTIQSGLFCREIPQNGIPSRVSPAIEAQPASRQVILDPGGGEHVIAEDNRGGSASAGKFCPPDDVFRRTPSPRCRDLFTDAVSVGSPPTGPARRREFQRLAGSTGLRQGCPLMAPCEKSRGVGAGPQAAARPTSSFACVRFSPALCAAPVFPTYAEPIQGPAPTPPGFFAWGH